MNVEQAIANLQQLERDLPKIVANEMVNFALDNIRAESWSGVPWAKRKPGSVRDSGRNLLVDTGAGRRSIKAVQKPSGASLTANEYMQAHNEGARIQGTFSVRTHTRTRKGRKETVQQHSRTVNFELPERRFTGVSDKQSERINKLVADKIVKALT